MTTNNTDASNVGTDRDFEREFEDWIAEMEAQIESTRQSEILTADDYGIVINVR